MTNEGRKLLVQAHLGCQRGFYFDEVVEFQEGAFAAFSSVIEDAYWNFAILEPEQLAVPSMEGTLRKVFESRARNPAIFVTSDSTAEVEPPKGTKAFAQEVWMVASKEDLVPPPLSSSLIVKEFDSESDISSAVSVFADAYTSDIPGVGYTSLPPEYSRAFRRGLSRSNQFGSIQLLGVQATEPAAVASVFFSNRAAGLYNVAVSRKARQQGFGSEISYRAAKAAFNAGASLCFLQTEPDGAVEKLYSKLGFKRSFRGNYFALE